MKKIKTDRVIETYLDATINTTRSDDVLEFIERNIDENHIKEVIVNLKNTLEFNENRFSFKIQTPSRDFRPYPYAETFENKEYMLVNQLLETATATLTKDDTVPMMRANYGVPIMPSLFGLDYKIVSNNLPWVVHVNSRDKVKEIIQRGIPNVKTGLGKVVVETYEYYKNKLLKFEKANKLIKLYHPDMQGPIDIAHLIWGNGIYYAFYDDPELVHELMNIVTDTYIEYMKHIKSIINDVEDDYVYQWGTLYKGKVVLRNDTAINLSGEIYKEFIQKYDEKILSVFGGGSVHYCGRGEQLISLVNDTKGVKARNYGQPPNMEFGVKFLQEFYDEAKEKKIPILGYHVHKTDMESILKSPFKTGVTYKSVADNVKDAIKMQERIKNYE